MTVGAGFITAGGDVNHIDFLIKAFGVTLMST